MKFGIIREGKIPPDSRVALTPEQSQRLKQTGFSLVVESSPNRCYTDREYELADIEVTDDVKDCEILLGIKEVPVEQLIPEKIYFFFSHTIKKQPYNRKLLQTVLEKGIRLIDYEVLTDNTGNRLIAFGFFAGMVGAHNGIWTYGKKTGAFELPRMKDMRDYAAAKLHYQELKLPPIKIVVTGTGRVGQGAVQVLSDMGIQQVAPSDFLSNGFASAVFTHLSSVHYVSRKDGATFDKQHFYQYPEAYQSAFAPFASKSDILIHGIYWNSKAPALFTKAEMRLPTFNIKVIADVTCDIAPKSSIPSTLKATTIEEPVFGYHPILEAETEPFQADVIDMMTIDNLPNEMPRDASASFGEQFIKHIVHELSKDESPMLERATIAKDGKLTPRFAYLQDYVSNG